MKRQKNKKIILGLTGGFGSGKTTVAGILRSYGALILDADEIAHQCLSRGSSGYKKIVDTFGEGVLGKNKKIERKKLAAVVFSDRRRLEKLNKIIHPQVTGIIKKDIRHSKNNIIVIDAPLLIEAGLERLADKLIVVKTGRRQQLKRIQKKLSLAKAEIFKRIKAQFPLERKVRMADFIIDNSGTRKQTRKQVKDIWKKMEGLWKS